MKIAALAALITIASLDASVSTRPVARVVLKVIVLATVVLSLVTMHTCPFCEPAARIAPVQAPAGAVRLMIDDVAMVCAAPVGVAADPLIPS